MTEPECKIPSKINYLSRLISKKFEGEGPRYIFSPVHKISNIEEIFGEIATIID